MFTKKKAFQQIPALGVAMKVVEGVDIREHVWFWKRECPQ
jgi:hypothetical protein